MSRQELMDRYESTQKQIRTIRESLQTLNRAADPDEQRILDSLEDDLRYYARLLRAEDSRGRRTEPTFLTTSEVIAAPAGEFRSFGDFANAVRTSAIPGGTLDPRLLRAAPTSVSQEGVGEDGGFAVPPAYSTEIFQLVTRQSAFYPLCREVLVPGNTYVSLLDDDPPWSDAKGPTVHWIGENQRFTASKVSLHTQTKRLRKLGALVPVTSELAEDAPRLDAYLRSKIGSKVAHALDLAVLQGNGSTEPLGCLTSPACIAVPAVGGQPTREILLQNLADMYARCSNPENAVWVIHRSVFPALYLMQTDGLGQQPVFLPRDMAAGRPSDTLLGRPIIQSQCAEVLGTKGDISLIDFSAYEIIAKAGGIRTDVSAHLYFDYHTLAFRFHLRVDGAPTWPDDVADRTGGGTVSPYVTLATR